MLDSQTIQILQKHIRRTGRSFLSYVHEAAAEYGVDKNIRYNHLVRSAAWDSASSMRMTRTPNPSASRRPMLWGQSRLSQRFDGRVTGSFTGSDTMPGPAIWLSTSCLETTDQFQI